VSYSYKADNRIAEYEGPEGRVEFHGTAGGITVFVGERMVQKDLGMREFACYMAHCLQAAHYKRSHGPNEPHPNLARYEYMLNFPDATRHMLQLLSSGKGTRDDFGKLIDRCIASLTEIRRRDATNEKEVKP
jgi:hypothetical protein